MHPLSIFPEILTYGLVAPLLLRLGVGVLILFYGLERYKKRHHPISIAHFIVGLLLIVGLYTQIAAILGVILNKIEVYPKWKSRTLTKEGSALYVLAGIILLSLLFTGPGFFAFDLPL